MQDYFEISPEIGLRNPWRLKDVTQVRGDECLGIRERVISFCEDNSFFQNHFMNWKSQGRRGKRVTRIFEG